MKARDVMTDKVVTVGPDSNVQRVAALMADNRISGLPVVSETGQVLGIVSESDLLRRTELGTDGVADRWTALLSKKMAQARDFAKAHGRKAHEVMSRPVVSVDAEADLSVVADLLERHRIKRVPVMEAGRLVGMIARSDLIRALSKVPLGKGEVHLDSSIIHETVNEALARLPWLDSSYLNASVHQGVVTLSGYVQSPEHRDAVRVLVEEIPGVERVEDDLTIGLPTLTWDGNITH